MGKHIEDEWAAVHAEIMDLERQLRFTNEGTNPRVQECTKVIEEQFAAAEEAIVSALRKRRDDVIRDFSASARAVNSSNLDIVQNLKQTSLKSLATAKLLTHSSSLSDRLKASLAIHNLSFAAFKLDNSLTFNSYGITPFPSFNADPANLMRTVLPFIQNFGVKH